MRDRVEMYTFVHKLVEPIDYEFDILFCKTYYSKTSKYYLIYSVHIYEKGHICEWKVYAYILYLNKQKYTLDFKLTDFWKMFFTSL